MTGLEVHLVYVGNYYHYYNIDEGRLKAFVFQKMEKYEMKSVILSMIDMWRWNLITKEKMEDIALNSTKLESSNLLIPMRSRKKFGLILGPILMPSKSFNADIETFFEGLKVAKVSTHRQRVTYFLPKLTDEEHELIKNKDQQYFKSFYFSTNPDVDENEMKRSQSESKFVFVESRRKTYILVNSLDQKNFCSVL